MIRSFACRDTERLFRIGDAGRFGAVAKVALRKLAQVHAATSILDLRAPPGNRLELLRADRAGQYSIRVNDRWRICFHFEGGDAHDVEIVDYH